MAADDVDFAGKGEKKSFGAKMRSCRQGIWDSQKKEFLGRTGASWAKIGLFYVVFYSCLAGFFAIMLVGFFSTLDDNKPTMTEMYSLIKQNPGMGYRPMVNKESTLIKFNMSDPVSYGEEVLDIVKYLREAGYIDANNTPSSIKEDSAGKPTFDLASMPPNCQLNLAEGKLNESFGYDEGKPCVLLKVNRVFNWTPQPFNESTWDKDSKLVKEMNATLGSRRDPNYVGVTCEGENDADVDNMGKVEFFPKAGFPVSYFPYTNAKHYRSPLVFAQFSNAKKGVVMQIWCKLWVANIKHNKNDKGGSVHFELLIDY